MTNIKYSSQQAVSKIVQACWCRKKDDSFTDVLMINFSLLHTTWGISGTKQVFKLPPLFSTGQTLAKNLA